MHRSFISLLLAGSVAVACRSNTVVAGNGVLVTEARTVPEFHALSVADSFDVEIAVGPTSVTLELDQNIIGLVETEVRDGVLEIAPTKDDLDLRPTARGRIRIAVPVMDDISASDDAHVVAQTASDALALTASGGGRIALSGIARAVTISATGAGSVDCKTAAGSAEITSTESSVVRVEVADRLSATATGAAVVTVVGNPPAREIVTTEAAVVLFTK